MDVYHHLLLIFIRTGINLLHLCSENRSKVVYIWSFFWIVHKLLSLFVITNKSVPKWNLSESRSDTICIITLYETISKNNYGGMNKRIKHLVNHSQQLFRQSFSHIYHHYLIFLFWASFVILFHIQEQLHILKIITIENDYYNLTSIVLFPTSKIILFSYWPHNAVRWMSS